LNNRFVRWILAVDIALMSNMELSPPDDNGIDKVLLFLLLLLIVWVIDFCWR
jgi:hypothetical protein